jgi:hypothetical protein
MSEPLVGNFTLKKMLAALVALFLLYLAWYFFIRKSADEKAADKASATINGLPIEEDNLSLSQSEISPLCRADNQSRIRG